MSDIELRLWSEHDAPLLRRGNTPEMTVHIGGPETDAQLGARHERYLRLLAEGEARPFVIVDGTESVGAICFWKTTWRGVDVFEAGWFIVPESQGRGVGSAALSLVVDDARAFAGGRRLLVAFPDRANGPSNALCRKAGFELAGQRTEEFRGAMLNMNEWVFDLSEVRTPSSSS
ncbi:GNAT family N-acetyltransferase [Microbacterium sp. AGC85]